MKQLHTWAIGKNSKTPRVNPLIKGSTPLTVFKTFLVCLACWLMPSFAKADTPIPTSVVSSYDAIMHRLTLTVKWTWGSNANDKYVTAAVFADLNGDGISPTYLDNPATYNSGGNSFPAGLSARDEFLGQLAISNIDGTASSSMYPGGDNTDNGIAAQHGFGPNDPRVLFPYGTTPVVAVGDSGVFNLTYDNVPVAPTRICVVMYDVHTSNLDDLSGGHSPRSANPGANTDNSVQNGNSQGTVSCSGLVVLRCAVDKTEAACQSQAAINASYDAWLGSVTASGCNGVLTNNSTGAPSASGGSKTVTFKYTQTGCPNQAPVTTCTATFTVLACTIAPAYYPDYNVTYVNVPVPGDVHTNDVVPAGTTYGTSPTLISSPAGSAPSITMNSDGTYSFVANVVGVYKYNVPVCIPGQPSPCPTSLLTITVLCASCNNNPPVANTDIASTRINTSVTIVSLANDKPGNAGGSLNPGSVTVTVIPMHGTVTVNPTNGNTTYTPATGYTGMDTLTYRVCETPSGLCATALQIISIKAGNAANSTLAADDYVSTSINTAVSGNAKTNDTDPEGDTQTITAQNTTVAGKGTLVLMADGSFTFTPVNGFSGPVNFTYTTTDNGTPTASAMATIYVLVAPAQSSTNPDFNSTFVNVHVQGDVHTNDKVPAGTTYGNSPALLSSPPGAHPFIIMNSDGTYDFVSDVVGVYVYNVPVCVPGQAAPCPPSRLTITVLDANSNSNAPVANVDVASTRLNTSVTLKSLANDHAGSPAYSLVPSSVVVVTAAAHGTTSVNTTTGDITYTPNAGFVGRDTLRYQVCDNQVPAKCAQADQIITVRDNNSTNSTDAADDYNIIQMNTVGTGNVKINDSDPEGNAQTVTPQNTTVAGKGTLVLSANGDYSFTPVINFTGPVDFPYTTTDNGTPAASAMATLHILVQPPSALPDLTPSIFNDGTTLIQQTTRDNVIRIFNIGQGATTAPVIFTIPKMLPAFQITINPNETFMDVFGGTTVNNAEWTIVEQESRYVLTSKPGVVIPAGGYKDIGVKVKAVGIKNSTGNLSVQIVFGTGGGETPYNNNTDNNTYSTN